jgi:SAM-dependent methyltransferase
VSDEYGEIYERDVGAFTAYSREATFLDQMFRDHGAGVTRVVDIAGGHGSHVLELARMGYRCAAADIDPDLLAIVGRTAAEHGLPVTIHPVDMRQFRLEGTYDAALNLFHAFQNVLFEPEEQLRFLRGVAALLAPGGLFVIELLPEENNLRRYPPDQRFPIHSARQQDGSTLTVTSTNRIVSDTAKDIVFLYETVRLDGSVEREEIVSPIRRVYLDEFAALCQAAGFQQVAAFGACDSGVPFADDSAKLVAVLKKPS